MKRAVAVEWLDQLAPSDPLAIGSRRDLRRVNFWMGNARNIRQTIQGISGLPRIPRLAELGAGDGTLLLEIARQLRWQAAEITLIDRRPAVSPDVIAAFKSLHWKVEVVAADVFEALTRFDQFDVITANLFLHHFSAGDLARLLSLIAEKTNAFVACEPKRCTLGLWVQPLLHLLGCNQVTRTDAGLSVRAGFKGNELSSLWPKFGWRTSERRAGLFSHLFTARRCAP